MSTVAAILDTLRARGSEKTRAIYIRHGLPADRTLGVSVADLKTVFKSIRGQQALAGDLYATGIMDAMYLAGMVADGAKMTPRQIRDWAKGAAGMPMIAEYTVPWVAVDHREARSLAMEWIPSDQEQVACAGWCTYAGILATQPDETLDLAEIESLLTSLVSNVRTAKNRVRYTMNNFVISTGAYVKPLLPQAKRAAKQLGVVTVDMGGTACKVPLATESIAKIEAAGRTGKKKKTIRC
jgi:3-methyladenine DNA glycosylase AlkD